MIFLASRRACWIGWTWWQERRVIPQRWVLVFSPLMMVPYALHHKVFTVRESAWELAGQPGHSKVFSPRLRARTIFWHWLNFFFSTDGEHSNFIVLSILGFLAVPFFLLLLVKNLPKLRTLAPAWQAWLVCSLGFLAHTALYLCYFWGKFDDPVIRRLSSLPCICFFRAGDRGHRRLRAELAKGRRIWPVLRGRGGGRYVRLCRCPRWPVTATTLEYYVGREMGMAPGVHQGLIPNRDYNFSSTTTPSSGSRTWFPAHLSCRP